MKLDEMARIVKKELQHIAKHPKPIQSEFRMQYVTRRNHDLGKNGDDLGKTATLKNSMKAVRERNPGCKFVFDSEFFELVDSEVLD